SYLHPEPQAYARFVCRRLKRKAPQVRIVLGVWNLAPEIGPPGQFAERAGADAAASTLSEAWDTVRDMLGPAQLPAPVRPPIPENEQQRVQAVIASVFMQAPRGGYLDELAHKVAAAFDAPIALVSLLDESRQYWKGACGLPDALERERQTPREEAVCSYVVASGVPLVVEDVSRDPRLAGNALLCTHVIRFYAGVPLRDDNANVIGTLCIIDTRPRTLQERERKLLQLVADELMAGSLPVAEGGTEPAGKKGPGENGETPAADGARPAPA